MAEASRHDSWQAGDSYDLYMGRWSRQVARLFLDWLDPRPDLDWLDVGCGTGALSAAVLDRAAPRSLVAIDPSEGFLRKARESVRGNAVQLLVGDAQSLPLASDSRDVVVSGLVLNFVADRIRALTEMKRVARSGGTVAFYVWDYPGGGIGFIRAFWDAAARLDPKASELTEDRRFPFCTPAGLLELARSAGLAEPEQTSLEATAVFRDFDDFWLPFTLGAGPAPGYCAALDDVARDRLKQALQDSLRPTDDGSISFKTRAWAIKAIVE